MKDRAAVTKKAAGRKGEERTKFLHDYNQKSYDHVLKIMQAENARLMPNKVKLLAAVVKAEGQNGDGFASKSACCANHSGVQRSALTVTPRAGCGVA